jgi:non-ribosomal peptide synthetase component F
VLTTVPLSVNQEAMWVAWRLDPGRAEFVLPLPMAVTGELDVARLRRAVARLAALHPVLRSRVLTTPDGICFTSRDTPPIDLVEHLVTADRDDAIRAGAMTRFDLDHGPLARVEVLRGPDYTVVLFMIHHIAFDGTSVALFLDELRQGYAGGAPRDAGDPAPVVRHAARSRALADGEEGREHRDYWRDVLAAPPTAPALPSGPADGRLCVLVRPADPDMVAQVRDLARALDVTYFTVMFGALFLVLRRHSGRDDQIVSAPFHNRRDRELADRIGFFANALPFRARMTGSMSCDRFLRDLRALVRAGTGHGELPLPALLRAGNLVGPDAHELTHQVVFEYWDAARDAAVVDVRRVHLSDDCVLELLDVLDVADYKLNVMLRQDASGTVMVWKDPVGCYGPQLLAGLADDYLTALRVMTAHPTWPLDAVAPPLPITQQAIPAPRIRPASRTAPALVADVAAVWSEVLQIPALAASDSFFELGGHSLLATSLLDRVSARFGVPLSLPDLFDHPRLGDFAAVVAGRANARAGPPAAGPTTGRAVPASSFQQGIWLAERIDPTRGGYPVALSWQVSGTLDPAALRSALARLVERQELLRTRLVDIDGKLHLEPAAPWVPRLDVVDLRDMSSIDQEERLREWSGTAVGRLSLADGRLLAAGLHTLAAGRQVLTLCSHHVVLDGGSVPVLLRELRRCYASAADPPPPGYRDLLAARQHGSTALEHWHQHLAGAPVSLGLPVPADVEPDGRVEVALAASIGTRLALVRARHQVSLFMVAATAVATVLHRRSGLADLTFGVPVSDRGGAAFADVVGPAMNTVVLRSRCARDTTVGQLLLALRGEIVTAFRHVQVPFEDVVARLRPARSPGRTPYVELLLNSLDQSGWAIELGAARLLPLSLADQVGVDSKVAVTITLITSGDDLRMVLTHRGDQLGHDDAEQLAAQLALLLNGFADQLDHPVRADNQA